ncbi:hypothetical protein THAOC_08615 [Thalassiosira oceanica]|uniref:Uncharacterized protein n=1 Tax=Thalassiosira oceanica TaxID=159749 RepID=K0THR2_THAOC|nr:hypothetical protein THAOC_08615 [Thalassiosira oceanica]|eukprot:EJK70062.1 hypothetical protein THAOC_08615 [Thalassiosira oceanica]
MATSTSFAVPHQSSPENWPFLVARLNWLTTNPTGLWQWRNTTMNTYGHLIFDQFPNQVIFPSQSSSALRTVLFSAVGFCTVQKSTTPVQKATRPGAAATAGPGKIVDNGVGIYTAAVAVECLYLFDMFLYAPEGAAVPAVAADGAAISCIFCSYDVRSSSLLKSLN